MYGVDDIILFTKDGTSEVISAKIINVQDSMMWDDGFFTSYRVFYVYAGRDIRCWIKEMEIVG